MTENHLQNILDYRDINKLCFELTENLKSILKSKLINVYLTGSLTYGDFNPATSDIDFLIILDQPLSILETKQIETMHIQLEKKYTDYAKRIESSYITNDMLDDETPPSRPYLNNGKFLNAKYGNEWLINLHAVYECGINLFGPALLKNISIQKVREASKQDFYHEWKPLINDYSVLNDVNFQAYTVLALCRILYREKNDDVVSKIIAADRVIELYNKWYSLIDKAKNHHNIETDDIIRFIEFVSNELGK